MNFLDILAYVLSLLGLGCCITSMLIKGNKIWLNLLFVFLGNFLVAISYLMEPDGINGSVSCFIGAAQSLIAYAYQKRQKRQPNWLIALYAAAFIVANFTAGGFQFFTLIATVAALSFVMCVIQDSGAKYRFWAIINGVLWTFHDIITHSDSALITHAVLLSFTVLGALLHDTKRKKKI